MLVDTHFLCPAHPRSKELYPYNSRSALNHYESRLKIDLYLEKPFPLQFCPDFIESSLLKERRLSPHHVPLSAALEFVKASQSPGEPFGNPPAAINLPGREELKPPAPSLRIFDFHVESSEWNQSRPQTFQSGP